MADDTTIRITLEGQGEFAGGGARGRSVGAAGLDLPEFSRFQQQLFALNKAMDPALTEARVGKLNDLAAEMQKVTDAMKPEVLREFAYQERQLAEARERLSNASKKLQEMRDDAAGRVKLDPVSALLAKEETDFEKAMERLARSLNSRVLYERIRQEELLAAKTKEVADAMQKQREARQGFIPYATAHAEPIINTEEETKRFTKSMEELQAAMMPGTDIIKRRAQQELELNRLRTEYNRRLEEEKELQAPTLEEIPTAEEEPSFWKRLLGLGTKTRGTVSGALGGTAGKIYGAGMDIASAASEGGDAGGMTSMVSAAGPVGAMVGVALAAGHAWVGAIKTFRDTFNSTTEGAGRLTASMISASESTTEFMGSLSAVTKQTGESLFSISPAASVVVSGLGSMGNALSAVTGQIDAVAQRYAQVNPDIAMALAVQDLRQLVGDFRRGQEGAESLVQYVRSSSEIQQKFEDTKIRILNKIMPAVLYGMDQFEKILPFIEGIFDLLGPIIRLLGGNQNDTNRRLDDVSRLLEELAAPDAIELPTNVIRRGYPFTNPQEGGR